MQNVPLFPLLYTHYFDKQAVFSFSEDIFELQLHSLIPDNSLLWHDPSKGKLEFSVPSSHEMFYEVKKRLDKIGGRYDASESGLTFDLFFPHFKDPNFIKVIKVAPTANILKLVVFPAMLYRDKRVYLLELYNSSSLERASDRIIAVSQAYSEFMKPNSFRIEYLGPVRDLMEFYGNVKTVCISLSFHSNIYDSATKGPKWPFADISNSNEIAGHPNENEKNEDNNSVNISLIHQNSIFPSLKIVWMECFKTEGGFKMNILVNKSDLSEVLQIFLKLESKPTIELVHDFSENEFIS